MAVGPDRGPIAALIRSVVLTMELQRSRRLVVRLVNSIPPALSLPVGRDESSINIEFIGSLAESMSWLRTIRHEIASDEFHQLARTEAALVTGVLGSG